MRKLILILLSTLVSLITNAQSQLIKEVFRLLPANKIYDLTLAIRDSMLEGKTYYPADNSTDEILAYNYGVSVEVKDYLYVSMSYETDQRVTCLIEIRSFKMTSGDHMILVSQAGGVWQVNYSQHELSMFLYRRDKKLIPYKKKIIPATDESVFMKPGIPAAVKDKILKNSNLSFDLQHEKIILSLNSNYISDDTELRKWLKGDIAYFDWIKDQFVVSTIEFE